MQPLLQCSPCMWFWLCLFMWPGTKARLKGRAKTIRGMSASAHRTAGDGQTQALIRRTPATIGSGAQHNIQPPHGSGDLVGVRLWPELTVNRFFIASQCGDRSRFGAFFFLFCFLAPTSVSKACFLINNHRNVTWEQLYYEEAFI